MTGILACVQHLRQSTASDRSTANVSKKISSNYIKMFQPTHVNKRFPKTQNSQICTALHNQLQYCLDQMEKKDFILWANPYKIYQNIDNRAQFKVDTRYKKTYWLYIMAITFSAVVFAAYSCIFEGEFTLNRIMHAWLFLGYSMILFFIWFYHSKSEHIVQLLNQQTVFEEKHWMNCQENDAKIWQKASLQLGICNFVKILRLILGWEAVLFGLSGGVMIEAPWNLVPRVILKLRNETDYHISEYIVESITRMLAGLYNYVCWRILLNMWILSTIVSLLIIPYKLLMTLKHFERIVSSHKNRDFQKLAMLYKEIQILCGFYNDIHKTSIVSAFLFLAPMVLAVGLFVLMACMKWLDALSVAIFLIVVQYNSTVILVMFQYLVKVYSTSYTLKDTLCRGQILRFFRKLGKDGKLAQKLWKGMSVIKMRFLRSNFFEKETPLVVMNFTVNMAINLVLLDNS